MRTVGLTDGIPDIEIGRIYNFGDPGDYKIIDKTSYLINYRNDKVEIGETICWVENIKTGEIRHISEKTLIKHLRKFNKVVNN